MDDRIPAEKNKTIDIRFKGPTFIDPLTGIFNRYYLDEFLPQEIRKASLGNSTLALIMIDLDGFKKINDTYGHLCGDKILTQISDVFKKAIRRTDTIIRYAGDEFIILLSTADIEKTRGICANLLSDIEKAVFKSDKGQDVRVTISMGYAVYPVDAEEQARLIDMADKAMYLSKKRGRNRASYAKEVTIDELSSVIAMDSFPCRKFIDRRQEMDKVKQLFGSVVKSNSLQAAIISGPSGVGRSRILSEIIANLKDEGNSICYAASSTHTEDPYHLFAQGIGDFIKTKGINNPQVRDVLLKLPLPELSELSLIIPQLREIAKKSGNLKTDSENRGFLLFKSLLDLLAELNNISPLLIVFDDLHWADKASLDLLSYLIKNEKNRRTLVVCAFSDDKLHNGTNPADLQTFLKEARLGANVADIKISNLSKEYTAEMLEAIFPGIGKSKEFTDLICGKTMGNPSFIEEMLKSLVENGIIVYKDNNWRVKPGATAKDVPASLEEIVKKKLKGLDDETKEMILQAAVIGQTFEIDILKRIGDKNEGFVSEMIDRVKNMRLVNEFKKSGKFNFTNKNTQDILYKELDKDERDKLHYKIAQALTDEHKDNLYDVAGEAAFHYSRVPQQEKTIRIRKELLEKTTELFNPAEITSYLERLTKSILTRKDKVFTELSDRMMSESSRFIIVFRGAIKKSRLYPDNSPVLLETLEAVCRSLDMIFEETDNLVLTDIEKNLVVNGKRYFAKDENYAIADDLLYIMKDHGIKTVSFKKGLREDELKKLIRYLSEAASYIIDKGGWTKIIENEKLEHIGVDEFRFISVDEYAAVRQEKGSLQDIMLMEFLMGKIDYKAADKEKIISDIQENPKKVARAIAEILNMTAKKGDTADEAKTVADIMAMIESQISGAAGKKNGPADALTKAVSELEPGIRDKVLRALKSEADDGRKKEPIPAANAVNDDLVLDMIVEAYKDNMHNPLVVKALIEYIVVSESRKRAILAKLEVILNDLGIDKKELAFVLGNIRWENLPIDRRIDMILALPQDYFFASVLSNINNILEELDFAGKKAVLKNTISRLLVKAKKIEGKARQDLLEIMVDFVKEPFLSKNAEALQQIDRIDSILGEVGEEVGPEIFAQTLEMIKKLINDISASKLQSQGIDVLLKTKMSAAKKYYLFMEDLLGLLIKRFKTEEAQHPEICTHIKNFVLYISDLPLMDILIYQIVNDAAKDKCTIQDIYLIIKDKLIDILINFVTKNAVGLVDPFKGFLIRKKVAELLAGLKEASPGGLKKALSYRRDGASAALIEVIGYLEDEESINWLMPFVHHGDPAIRIAAVQALSKIKSEKIVEILSNIAKEGEDSDIRDLANSQLQKLKKKTSS